MGQPAVAASDTSHHLSVLRRRRGIFVSASCDIGLIIVLSSGSNERTDYCMTRVAVENDSHNWTSTRLVFFGETITTPLFLFFLVSSNLWSLSILAPTATNTATRATAQQIQYKRHKCGSLEDDLVVQYISHSSSRFTALPQLGGFVCK